MDEMGHPHPSRIMEIERINSSVAGVGIVCIGLIIKKQCN